MGLKGFRFLAVATRFWRPGDDCAARVAAALDGRVRDGDVVVVSEKAVSTASGNIVDEGVVKPSLLAWFLARFWVRCVWGYALGRLCRLRENTVYRFRNYPVREGSAHKQLALRYCGFLQTLMPLSEGGIDGSNLPYSFVSLPLKDAPLVAEKIQESIETKLGKRVAVMIVDTDKTYSWRNFHFTPRPKPIRGIHSKGGVFAYIFGRAFKLKKKATPLAVVGAEMSIKEALKVAELANRARGFGAGRTVWDMAKVFNVSLTNVSWEMLDKIEHKPIIIVRRTNPTC